MIDKYTSECLSCLNPLCEKGCPVKNRIRDFIKALKENNFSLAQALLYSENPFPELTCRVCAYEKQCEGHCVKNFKGQPVIVHAIEQYISDNSDVINETPVNNGHKIALIGAGVANLALAKLLALSGYTVTIFEAEAFIGGAIKTGIPDFRLEKKYLDTIYQELCELKVEFFFDHKVDGKQELEKLLSAYDRVVIGTGARKENKLGIEGEQLAVGGLELLYDLNINANNAKYQAKKALVVGGGNVAIDVARSLKRFVDNVTIVYRRSEVEMPANLSEIKLAKDEAINFEFQVNPSKLEKNPDGSLKVTLVRMELGEKDASGRASFHVIEGSDFSYDTDLVVSAIGQKYLPLIEDMKVEKHKTSYENVYIVGDANLGPSSVSHCIGDAKELKLLIDSSF